MIRTDVRLADKTYEALLPKAFARHKFSSALVRGILSEAMGRPLRSRVKPCYRFTLVGMIRGKARAVSKRDIDYLNEGRR